MQLDDFRRQWQQPAAAGTTAAPVSLQPGTAASTPEPIRRLRRNVWLESLAMLFFIGLALYRYPHLARLPVFFTLLVVNMLGFGYFYVRQLTVLRRLTDSSQAVRSYLATQLGVLRELLRLYYWLNMVSFWLLMAGVAYLLWPHFGAAALKAPWQWGGLSVLYVALSLLLMHIFTRSHLHRAYGRYLSQLENATQELQAS